MIRFDLHNGKPPDDYLVIDRTTIYGNPYSVKQYGRDRCLALYRVHIFKMVQHAIETQNDDILKHFLREEILEGRVACWCPPNLPCHGDILKEVAEYALKNYRK